MDDPDRPTDSPEEPSDGPDHLAHHPDQHDDDPNRSTRNPSQLSEDRNQPSEAKKAVIIYSRRDARIREELDQYLIPLERRHRIERFDDTGVGPDVPWRDEVVAALANAQVAVLLVSQRFLTSPFILDEELPPLLRRAAQGGVTILSLVLTPCVLERLDFLSRYQVVNDPSHPLSGLRRHNREAVYDHLARVLETALG